ncbi:VWA domain-containing protein, partial [Actinomadura sp. LOL_011]
WCRIIGTDPDQPAPATDATDTSGTSSALAKAIGATLTAVESTTPAVTSTGGGTGGSGSATGKVEERRRERQARDAAEKAAGRVFAASRTDTGRRGNTAITGTRPPRADEKTAARRLARRLRAAAHRDRVTTTHTSPTPPGRLSMRGALAADAQRAAGAAPTAEPFTRTTRRHVPAPPLRIGIACDVSGSMKAFADPVASAAWIIATAARHVPDADSATVIFGARVRPVTRPGQRTAGVSTFEANDPREDFVEAVDALDAALDLTRPGAARLLVVVSDGIFKRDQPAEGQKRIDRLTAAGCAVLWLAPSEDDRPMDGAHVAVLPDPAQAADTIGAAAARALRDT